MNYTKKNKSYLKSRYNRLRHKTFRKKGGNKEYNLKVEHVAGFFSTCSVLLDRIIDYFNKNKVTPKTIDSKSLFDWYKTGGISNIKSVYFKDNEEIEIPYTTTINYNHEFQFNNYKLIEYNRITPFIKKYFTPSNEINDILADLKNKYKTNEKKICTLFYRGNDKSKETKLPSYDDIKIKALEIQKKDPSVTFFIQSDEKGFINEMSKAFINSFYFKDDIRTINKSNTTVNLVFNKEDTFKFSKKYLAITLFMSESKYIICNSGNCSIWIMLFRGNSDNVNQYLNGEWF